MDTLYRRLKLLYGQLIAISNAETAAGERLYERALKYVGVDASPLDAATDAYGCAESLSTILHADDPTFGVVTGTYTLMEALEKSLKFVRVQVPRRGDIFMYATGTGGNPSVPNGHTGVVGENGRTYSNNSNSGQWDDHLTLAALRRYLRDYGQYPEKLYRKII